MRLNLSPPLSFSVLKPILPNKGETLAYLISYDVNEKDSWEYDDLWAELKRLGAVRVLYSEWVCSSRGRSAANIYQTLLSFVQAKDRLLVCSISTDIAWEHLLISDEQFRSLLMS